MPDVEQWVEPVVDERVTAGEPQWPGCFAFWAAWLVPATTARRTARLPLWRAWGVHFVAALLAIALTMFLSCWDWRRDLARGFQEWVNLLGEIIEEFGRNPLPMTAATVAIVLGVEIGFLLLAALLMAWGARDERVRDGYVHTLRQVWLHTASVLPAILIIGATIVCTDNWRKDWFAAHPYDFNPPIFAPGAGPPPAPPAANVPPKSPEWKAYWAAYRQYLKQQDAAGREYGRAWRALYNQHCVGQPWRVRYTGVFCVPVICLVTGWFVWALLRAVNARPGVRWVERPPMCETCGYNLSVASMEGRCSECGVPVVESLGPEARPEPIWERRGEVGRLRTWWRCSIDPMLRPLRFGRQVRVRPAGSGWKSMLRLNSAGMGLVGVSAFVWFACLMSGLDAFRGDWADAATAAVAAGFFTAIFSLLWMIAAAGLVGLAARVLYGRNLLPAAMQNAAYLGGYLVAAGLVWMAFVTGIVVIQREHLFLEQLQPLGAWWFVFMSSAITGSAVVGLLVYLALVFRATSGARYANR